MLRTKFNLKYFLGSLFIILNAVSVFSCSYAAEDGLFYSPWKRTCQVDNSQGSARNCVIERFVFKDSKLKTRIAGINFQTSGNGPDYSLAIISPLGSKISYGVDFQVLENKPVKLPFLFCDQPGCFSQMTVDKKMIVDLSSAKLIVLKYQLLNSKIASIKFDISGFKEALAEN
jgi:invasion protein IalB